MSNIEYNVFEIETNGLSGFRSLTNEDVEILTSANITKTFKPNNNFIELSYYTLNDVRLETIPNYTGYTILSGDSQEGSDGNTEIGVDVQQDYITYGYEGTEVKALYNFLNYTYSDNTNPQDFYIENISPDRTEVRLVSINLGSSDVLETTDKIISQYNVDTYSPDYFVYFGNNIFYSIVNIATEQFRETTAVILKLYKPLPSTVNLKLKVNIVEKISNSVAFEINTTITQTPPVIPTLRGANFSVEIDTQSTEPSQYYNYNELFSFPTTNTYREINSLFNEKGAELGIDYSDFNNFINYSSAEERIRNFKYKLELIEQYQNNLNIISAATYSGTGVSGSREYYENLIKGTLNNFDHYERHLYYTKGVHSWPKANTTKPYINQLSSTTEATTWYNEELKSAILYDAQNVDILTNTIPSYLRENPANQPYELFIHMIAQHFDNLWLYTDSVSKKYDADNRLDRGVSKDLVEELLKNFGVKLYTSNKSAEDLFRYFTVNTYDTQEEYLPNGITESGQDRLSQNDYQKEIYKRIYHNLPLLFKSKGTERGLRALINCFGIPSDILKIKIYGGQSAENLPFYGGEQAWTSSLDKIRLDNTGSIVEGDTLSYYTSISNTENKYTNDLHRIEVGFSPSDNIDNYIVSQSAVLFPSSTFNIDDYIGDPREINTNSYNALRGYADEIFNNVDRYDLKDFVRLIKFFDNVVFRMVKDFVPARAVTDAGIIIKPHLLERSKHTSPVMTWTQPEYSGSIDTAFSTGSNGGAYANIGTGATGTLLDKESSTRVLYTSSTPEGRRGLQDKLNGQPKFNGELHNSSIQVTDGELNNSNPFKNLEYLDVEYRVQFFLDPPLDICTLETQQLSDLIIDPGTSNSNFTNYNLGNMFPGSSGQYNYDIEINGVITTLTGQNVAIDLLQGGNYAQYQIISVTATHINNTTTFSGNCTNTRQAIIVSCDLAFIPTNKPTTLIPNLTYNLNDWWNSTNSLNTDITYTIGNTEYGPAEVQNFEFPETEYSNGELIEISIRENNSPEACKLEVSIPYNNCIILPIESPFTLDPGDSYDFPYNFSGVSNTATSFYFRFEWCNNNINGCSNPNYVGQWVLIDNNFLINPEQVSTIIGNYPTANNLDFNETIPAPQYNSFTEIQNYLDLQIDPSTVIQIRFRAQNSNSCIVDHTRTVITGPQQTPLAYNQLSVNYNNTLPSACCQGPTQTIFTTATTLDTLLSRTILQPPPIYSSTNPLVFAPSGWYTDGVISRQWNANVGYWGTPLFQDTSGATGYIFCTNNINIDLTQCTQT